MSAQSLRPNNLSLKSKALSPAIVITAALLILIVIIFFWGNELVTAIYNNLGSIELNRALLDQSTETNAQSPGTLELYTRSTKYLLQALQRGRNSARVQQSLAKAYRGLARAYVERGEFDKAKPILEAFLEEDPDDQFVLRYVAKAYVGSKEFAKAKPMLEALLEQNPEDQLVLYDLARVYEEVGERERAAGNYETLRYFNLEEGKIPPYLASLTVKLEEYGIWGRDEISNMVSFLVWQEEWGQAEEVLDYMSNRYPDEPLWAFYRGEIYDRRGDWEKAAEAYERVIKMEPGYAEAYLRMGWMYERKAIGDKQQAISDLDAAAIWYGRYRELASEDLVGLKRLMEVYKRLGRLEEARLLQKEWEVRTDDKRIVAEVLGIGEDDFELGENLVKNGGFEEGKLEPRWWGWLPMVDGRDYNAASFVGGVDEFEAYEGVRALRIDGFWIQRKPELQWARAGYWYGYQKDGIQLKSWANWYKEKAIELKSNTLYLLSFYYKTKHLREGNAAVWISSNPEVLFANDYMLPNTDGSWRRFVAISWNRKGGMDRTKPLLRSWGVGNAWFDGVEMREIALKSRVSVEDTSTRFLVK